MTDSGMEPGYRHLKCYANIRGGCSTKISGEHYISHSLIRLYTFNDPEVFLKPTPNYRIPVEIKPKKFVANVLCTAHNNGLSAADQAALEFATFLRTIAIGYKNSGGDWGGPEEITVSGDDFERWILKLLITHAAAEVYTRDDQPVRAIIPDIAVDLLLGNCAWPPGWGMCIGTDPSNAKLRIDPFSRPETVIDDWWGARPLIDGRTDTLAGGIVDLSGVNFPVGLMDQSAVHGVELRPASLTWVFNGVPKRITFVWAGSEPHRTATFTMTR